MFIRGLTETMEMGGMSETDHTSLFTFFRLMASSAEACVTSQNLVIG
jgi:hypothetical protein